MVIRRGSDEGDETTGLGRQVEAIQTRLERADRQLSSDDASAVCFELRALLHDSLRALSRGELRSPGKVVKALEPLAWFVEKHGPGQELSQQELARQISTVLDVLRLAAEAVDLPAFEAELKNRSLPDTHLGVLQTLLAAWEEGGAPLRCADVRKRSGLDVTEQRIGQILRELSERHLATRTPWRGRGGEVVPFYMLTDVGVDLCRRGGLRPIAAPSLRSESPFQIVPRVLDERPRVEKFEPRRPIVAFSSALGGVGTSLTLAHVATFLQKSRPADKMLLIDLDIDSPELGRVVLGGESAPTSRGIWGLLLDYHDRKIRAADLPAALLRECLPVPHLDPTEKTRLLPAGALKPDEVSRARRKLREEIQVLCDEGPTGNKPSFVLELRRALESEMGITLVDTPPALRDPVAAYFGSVLLADTQVLLIKPFSSDVGSMTQALKAFSSRDPLRRGRGPMSVLPVLARVDANRDEDAREWYVGEALPAVRASLGEEDGPVSALLRINENSRLSRGKLALDLASQSSPHSALYHAYNDIAGWTSTHVTQLSKIAKIISSYLDPKAVDESNGGILLGMLFTFVRDGDLVPHVKALVQQRMPVFSGTKDLFSKLDNEKKVARRSRGVRPAARVTRSQPPVSGSATFSVEGA